MLYPESAMITERHVSLFRNGRNQAIRIRHEFELEGTEAIIRKEGARQTIRGNDLLIVAHARALYLSLVTHSFGEFESVPGLRLADWLDSTSAGRQ